MKSGRRLLKVSVSELLGCLLGESYAPREVLEENRVIHARLGLDGDEEYCMVLGDLALVFKPDAVRDGIVYELKVQRLKSDREKLLLHAWCQLQLEMHALGLEKGKIMVYHFDDGGLEEMDVGYDWEVANVLLNFWRSVLETRSKASSLLKKLLAQSLSPQASS